MAETMPLEMRALALEQPWSLVRGACSWKNVDIPSEVDSAAAAAELAWYKAAATWGGKPKSASWSDVTLFFFPDSAANKVEVKTKPAAWVVGKSKAASATFFIEPAARVDSKEASAGFIKPKPAAWVVGKSKAASATFFIEPAARVDSKAASAGFIKPAARVEGKAASAGSIKPAAKVEAKAASASCIKPASSLEGNTKRAAMKPEPPKPKVVSSGPEIFEEDEIQRLLKNNIKRPTPLPEIFFKWFPNRESHDAAHAAINKAVDVYEDMAKQYKEKGFAVMGVEHLDNGRKRLSILPEEARLRFAGERVVA